jgi:uncharacterized protein (TIGR03118 family)
LSRIKKEKEKYPRCLSEIYFLKFKLIFMKKRIYQNKIIATIIPAKALLLLFFVIFIISACNKDNNDKIASTNFTQVNLVASTATYAGVRVDPNMLNGWGIAFGPTGTAWISAEGSGTSAVYDKDGNQVLPAVAIPSATGPTGGHPTGQVFNGTADFVLANSITAKFIFAGADGVISAWNTGGAAEKVIDKSSTSAYLGIALANDGGNNFLYAANFKMRKIDVFDKNFAEVSKPFTDPALPAGYSPFNIQNIGGQLYVMYALVDDVHGEETKGAGLGYVDIYNPNGSLVKRFASQGQLNAPWGIAMAPAGFFNHHDNTAILIGNFGDGKINAYSMNGDYLGHVQSHGVDVSIDGLWGISFGGTDPNRLFFAAGPNDEQDGLFGYLKE